MIKPCLLAAVLSLLRWKAMAVPAFISVSFHFIITSQEQAVLCAVDKRAPLGRGLRGCIVPLIKQGIIWAFSVGLWPRILGFYLLFEEMSFRRQFPWNASAQLKFWPPNLGSTEKQKWVLQKKANVGLQGILGQKAEISKNDSKKQKALIRFGQAADIYIYIYIPFSRLVGC